MSPRLLWEDPKVSSAMIIEYTALASGAPVELVREVVDGFWDYVSQPSRSSRHKSSVVEIAYSGDVETHILWIPHFGRFRLRRFLKYNWNTLSFRSLSNDVLQQKMEARDGRPPSDRWVAMVDQEDPAGNARLSVKRNMACVIADARNLNLATTYRVLWTFLETVTRLFIQGDQEIAFFRRGVLYPRQPMSRAQATGLQLGQAYQPSGIQYRLRCYQSFNRKLAEA